MIGCQWASKKSRSLEDRNPKLQDQGLGLELSPLVPFLQLPVLSVLHLPSRGGC